MHVGLLLIVIGFLFVLKNLGLSLGIQWDLIWPILLIVLGFGVMSKHKHHGWRMWCGGGRGCNCGCGSCCGKKEEKSPPVSE